MDCAIYEGCRVIVTRTGLQLYRRQLLFVGRKKNPQRNDRKLKGVGGVSAAESQESECWHCCTGNELFEVRRQRVFGARFLTFSIAEK